MDYFKDEKQNDTICLNLKESLKPEVLNPSYKNDLLSNFKCWSQTNKINNKDNTQNLNNTQYSNNLNSNDVNNSGNIKGLNEIKAKLSLKVSIPGKPDNHIESNTLSKKDYSNNSTITLQNKNTIIQTDQNNQIEEEESVQSHDIHDDRELKNKKYKSKFTVVKEDSSINNNFKINKNLVKNESQNHNSALIYNKDTKQSSKEHMNNLLLKNQNSDNQFLIPHENVALINKIYEMHHIGTNNTNHPPTSNPFLTKTFLQKDSSNINNNNLNYKSFNANVNNNNLNKNNSGNFIISNNKIIAESPINVEALNNNSNFNTLTPIDNVLYNKNNFFFYNNPNTFTDTPQNASKSLFFNINTNKVNNNSNLTNSNLVDGNETLFNSVKRKMTSRAESPLTNSCFQKVNNNIPCSNNITNYLANSNSVNNSSGSSKNNANYHNSNSNLMISEKKDKLKQKKFK
jgi:hypothetical protein